MDAGPDSSPPPPAGFRECAKDWCHTIVPINSPNACKRCRQIDAANQRKSRQARKEAKAGKATSTTGKRRRPSSDSANDRPATRPRREQSSADSLLPSDAEEDHRSEDEDALFGDDGDSDENEVSRMFCSRTCIDMMSRLLRTPKAFVKL
ncbi:hypothetical protein B0H10DRAFT_20807 [Mycena sp. CBHHK59/15]|nr:hypothetical protein B0H10DRAFT_20807 [Mycena sp. CBHHK59/15]